MLADFLCDNGKAINTFYSVLFYSNIFHSIPFRKAMMKAFTDMDSILKYFILFHLEKQ